MWMQKYKYKGNHQLGTANTWLGEVLVYFVTSQRASFQLFRVKM